MRAAIESAARAEYPREACGVLVGRVAGGTAHVERATRARNRAAGPTSDRFEVDPGHLVLAEDEARAEGLDVVGVWHSHPDRPATPSQADRDAAWGGWSYVIASVGPAGVRELRSWRLCEGSFRREEIAD